MNRPNGFTLIEVLVSLAISVAVLGVAAVSLERVAFQDKRSHSDFERAAALLRFRHALSRDLRRLRPSDRDGEALRVERGEIAGMRADRLRLSRVGSLYYSAEGAERHAEFGSRTVLYGCREQDGSLTICRMEKAPGDAVAVAVPVLRGVSHFRIMRVDGGVQVEVGFGDRQRRTVRCCPHVTHVPGAS